MPKALNIQSDVSLALLGRRTTPIDGNLPSSAEALNRFKYRSNLTVKFENGFIRERDRH